jgi:hypothetical protein
VSGPRADALPEGREYRDTGCDLFPSCLRCPLPRCRYETEGGVARMLREARDRVIVASWERGEKAEDIARSLGMGKRQVYRVVSGRESA